MSISSISSIPATAYVSRVTFGSDGKPSEPVTESIQITQLDLSLTPLAPDFMMRVLEARTMPQDGEQESPPNQPYADIKVDGKTVATLSNSGALQMRMDRLGQIPYGGPDEDGLHGPALAQFRAEKIAKALGGEITRRDTAMTQDAFDALRDRKSASAYGTPTASARDGRGTDLTV